MFLRFYNTFSYMVKKLVMCVEKLIGIIAEYGTKQKSSWSLVKWAGAAEIKRLVWNYDQNCMPFVLHWTKIPHELSV